MPPATDHELLLHHTGWLRVLAFELVGDVHAAEDVVQETWLAAIRHPPEVAGDERRLQAWLREVVRNLSMLTRRRDANRAERELRSARPEAEPSVEESMRRAALQRELMESVMSLEPSQREVVVLRYLDELPPREIAKRLGISGTAVRSRLARALATLRKRLDLEDGQDRTAWSLAFGPPTVAAAVGHAAPLGGLLVKTQTQLLVIAAALVAVSSAVWWAAREASTAAEASDTAMALLPAPQAELPRDPVQVPELEEPVRREATAPARPVADAGPAVTLRGRVTDTVSRPVAGLEVRFVHSGERGEELARLAAPFPSTTDGSGAFEMPFPTGYGHLVAENSEWITLLDVPLGLGAPPEEPTIIVASRCAYAGVVVDEDGLPLERAPVRVVMDLALLRGLRPGVRRTEYEPSWFDSTDSSGAFELLDVGWSEGLRLQVEVGGYETVVRELPRRSESNLRLVMRRPPSGPQAFAGVVVGPDDELVADAVVLAGENVTRSDRQGAFVLDRTGVKEEDTLRALKPGYLPAELAVAQVPPTVEDDSAPLVLRLGETPLTITGRVVDSRGDPVAGVHVWIHEGLRLPRNDVSAHRHVEDAIGFEDGLLSNRHRYTADDGLFELSGLLPRAYRVWAAHPATLEIIDAGPIEAGTTGLVLAFTDSGAQRVAGRVVSFTGDPLPGVRLFFGSHEARTGTPFYTPLMVDRAPQSDAEGRFEFEALCARGAYLLPAGAEISMQDDIYLDEIDDLENIVIRIPRPCTFQVLLEQDPDEADALRVLDEQGNVLSLMVQAGTTTLVTNGGMRLEGGRSDLITTDERAHTLVLSKGGTEVRRVPLELEPGQVRILRY